MIEIDIYMEIDMETNQPDRTSRFEVRTPPEGPRQPLLVMTDRHTEDLFDLGLARQGVLLTDRPRDIAANEPFASALARHVDDLLARFGRCLIVDVRSFPTVPLPDEDPELDRPDVCIGYERFHFPEPLVRALEGACREASLRPARNTPYAGSYVPDRQRERDERMRSVRIELRRGLFMDENTGERCPLFATRKLLVEELLRRAASF